MELDRRQLFKVLGLTAAGSVLPGCEKETHNLVPWLLPDEESIPGVANWYASTCGECEAGCGTLVRVFEGRAKKIEGNPRHPLNQGKLCARGQASLQGLYNPDRIRHPMKRIGNRGDGQFEKISWEHGLAELAQRLQHHHGQVAMLSRPLTGTLGHLIKQFMEGIDGTTVCYDTTGTATLLTAIRKSFGMNRLPSYDLANTDYLLSFGTPFLEHWVSPVHFGVAYGQMRQGRPATRGQFVHIEPRLSLTAANADRWIPIRPGTEGLLALGIGQLLMEHHHRSLPRQTQEALENSFYARTLNDIIRETDVAKEHISRIAQELSNARAPLILGGGMASSHTNGTFTLMAVNALNIVLGNMGQAGGITFLDAPPFLDVASIPPATAEQSVLDLAKDFETGTHRMLLLHHSNPRFSLPPSTHFDRVFDQAESIISFSSFLDESTIMADLILPDHTPLESWFDHPHGGLAPTPTVGVAQPAVQPQYDTRAVGDVILHTAHQLGNPLAQRLPWKDFEHMLRATWKDFLSTQYPHTPFERLWTERLQAGGWWETEASVVKIPRSVPPSNPQSPSFLGDTESFPFYFYPFPSLALHDGRGANRPWLQELPDTLTSSVWGTWVEINPKTAKQLGLHQGDLARVTSPYGSVDAHVMYFPGMRPDMVAMPIGQGHTAYGRYAQNRGANPLVLLGPAFDSPSGCLATGATRVRIQRIKGRSNLVVLNPAGQSLMPSHDQHTGGL